MLTLFKLTRRPKNNRHIFLYYIYLCAPNTLDECHAESTENKIKIQNENMRLRRESNQWPLAFQRAALSLGYRDSNWINVVFLKTFQSTFNATVNRNLWQN